MASSYDPLPVNEREQNYSVETYSTPTSPAQFLSLLSRFPRKSTRELVKPYLLYETWLRKAFAKPHAVVGGPEDLASIYDGHESSFKIRTIDRETTAAEKYIMPLKEREEELGGQLAIAGSLEIFRENFNAFTHGILDGINWSNIVVAGSAALLPLLSPRRDEGPSSSAAVGPPLENYFDNIAKASDIDIFIYGINDEKLAIWRISEIEATIRKNQRIVMGEGLSLHTKNAITFIAPRYPHRHVQIILRLYDSITEILTGFDVDCACVAFDGNKVYSSPRGITAISTRTNSIDLTRRSHSYENRLFKYRQHKFDVFWEPLDRSQIKKLGPNYMQLWEMKGLARLLLFESNIKREYTGPYDEPNPKNLKRIDEARDPVLMTEDHYHSSGYTGIEIPHHIIFTADKIHDFVRKNAKEPFKFGTLNEILYQESAGRETAKVSPTLKFIKEDCGRQMIGSFYPWTSSSKIEALVHDLYQLRSKNSSSKSIIFSQFTTMLQLVEWRLRRAGITTVMLDGSMTPAQRQASINHFMTDVNVECFLVSLKAGGVALNLTEANKVFIVDPWWNPAAEWQSADRCHRIGQARPCSITRLCIEDSVESRMVLLQEKKANMIHSTINADESAMENLTPEDMQFLFRGN